MTSRFNCNNPEFLGEGGQGIVVKCTDDFEKQYAVKLSDPDRNNTDCSLLNEKQIGMYISNNSFTKPILFNDTKIGEENIIKYYNLGVIGLHGENIHGIKTDRIKLIEKDIKEHKKNHATQEQINVHINLRNNAINEIRRQVKAALKASPPCLSVIENCDQGDLYQFLEKHPEYISDPSLFKDMVYQIFTGLVYFYNKKACHWDLKPENILVKTNTSHGKDPRRYPRKYLFKIADYGTVLINPVKTIRGKLSGNGKHLMTKDAGLEFIRNQMPLIEINDENKENDLDIISQGDLLNQRSKPYNLLLDLEDITSIFQSTSKYTPQKMLALTTYYRDMYAFVLCIYMVLVRNDSKYDNKNNPNDIYIKNNRNTDNLPMSVLASKKKHHNYIYQYCSSKLLKHKTKHLKNLGYQAKLLWHIARIVKDIEEEIMETQPKLYYITPPKTNDSSGKPDYFTPQKVIIDISQEICKNLYERIGELFETRISKTLKQINKRRLAAQTTTPKLLTNTSSSNNNFNVEYEIPENIVELLDKHIVFVDANIVPSQQGSITNLELDTMGDNPHQNEENHEELLDAPEDQTMTLPLSITRRGSFASHRPPRLIPEFEKTTNFG
jgi:serine/threonine protein kinase